MPEAVRLLGVRKRFGTHTAVAGLDLVVPTGSIYGLLGPNGSGKTTTLRMIMGILVPDEGEARLLGGRPDTARQRRVGYLPEERGLYRRMRVLDVLVFLAEIRGVERSEGRRRALDWLERLGLGAWRDKRVEDLSKGMQQKVQFIGTVLHEPELLVLDEPFSGLDPINQDVLEGIVLEFHARGTTILFSTHLMDQAERLCERVCLISRARKVLDGDLREIKRRERKGVVAVELEDARMDGSGDEAGWLDAPEIVAREAVGGGLHLILREGADPQRLLERAVRAGARLRRWELLEPRLHEIFVRHAGALDPADSAGGAAGPECSP